MIDKEFFVEFLFNPNNKLESKINKTSTIKGLILNARELSGRDLNTGQYAMNDLTAYNFENQLYISKKMNGLLFYLILLEQIGSIFNDKKSKSNGIMRALEIINNNFKKETYYSIVGLRNSLVHKFSLCTESKGIGKSYKYQLNWSFNNDIIKTAELEWDGIFGNKSDKILTNIFVESLIDEIEKMLSEVIKKYKIGEIFIEPTIDELIDRYTII